jgi:hypothetical protein
MIMYRSSGVPVVRILAVAAKAWSSSTGYFKGISRLDKPVSSFIVF